MDLAQLAEGLSAHTTGFTTAVAGADPDVTVPTCPEWTLRVLVGHVGQAQRWAADIVRSGPSPVPDPTDADPGSVADWPDWLRTGADELTDAVLAAGDRPVWTFFGDRPAVFWLRRMVHDLVVHHADAAATTGAPFGVSPALAGDAISEWLEVLCHPATLDLRPGFEKLRGTGQTLQLRPDTGPGWLITRVPDGVRWARATTDADVTLSGPVQDLVLVLTRRAPVDRVTVAGDRDLVDHWLANTLA